MIKIELAFGTPAEAAAALALQALHTFWMRVASFFLVRLLALRSQGGDVPKAVAQLIAACALSDAAAVALSGGSWPWVLACVLAYLACRLFQKFIPGT